MHCHEYVCQSDCQSDSLEARPAGLQSEAPYPFSNTKSDWWAGQESNLHSFRGGFTFAEVQIPAGRSLRTVKLGLNRDCIAGQQPIDLGTPPAEECGWRQRWRQT